VVYDYRKSDLVEDAVELEGIQGTILGLQAWIDSLQAEQVMLRRQRYLAQHKARQKWGASKRNNRYDELGSDTQVDDVLEGLGAWMRGLRDVEEGFQSRARARRTRRERRQEMLEQEMPRARDKTEEDDSDAGLWTRAFPRRV
jgi:hypothetical protein